MSARPFASGAPPAPRIVAANFKPLARNSLVGFCALTLIDIGLVIEDVTVHRKNEERWIGMPARPVLTKDRQLEVDPATGKIRYASIPNFTDASSRRKFQDAALSQLAQFRAAGRVTAAQAEEVDRQNLLVLGSPASGRYAVCTTPHEPSNPSAADDTVKYARNVLRGLIDAANAATPAPDGPSPSVTELVATYVHLHVIEAVEFESWSAIASDVVAAGEAWQSSAPRP